jgi:hypothetical protein
MSGSRGAAAEAIRKAEEEEKRNLRLRNFRDTWGMEFSSLNKVNMLDKLPAKVEGMANQVTGVVSPVAKLENPGGTPASVRRVVQIGGRTISRNRRVFFDDEDGSALKARRRAASEPVRAPRVRVPRTMTSYINAMRTDEMRTDSGEQPSMVSSQSMDSAGMLEAEFEKEEHYGDEHPETAQLEPPAPGSVAEKFLLALWSHKARSTVTQVGGGGTSSADPAVSAAAG